MIPWSSWTQSLYDLDAVCCRNHIIVYTGAIMVLVQLYWKGSSTGTIYVSLRFKSRSVLNCFLLMVVYGEVSLIYDNCARLERMVFLNEVWIGMPD